MCVCMYGDNAPSFIETYTRSGMVNACFQILLLNLIHTDIFSMYDRCIILCITVYKYYE